MLHSTQSLLLLLFPCTIIFLCLTENNSRREPGREYVRRPHWSSNHSQQRKASKSAAGDSDHDLAEVTGSRVSQVTMQFGRASEVTIERALRTHIHHGEIWGYPTHLIRDNIVGSMEESEIPYNKLWALMKVMLNEMMKPAERRSDWLVWFDSDTVLTNPNIPWTIFLPPSEAYFREINLLVTMDLNGFNAGVMLIRVCEWSLKLLSDAISVPRLQPGVELPFFEQTALQTMFDRPDWIDKRLYVPRHWFNVYDDKYATDGEVTYPGSMLVHFATLEHLEPMGDVLDQLDREPEKLQIPLVNTTYLGETEAYWSRVYDAKKHLYDSQQYQGKLQTLNNSIYEANVHVFGKVRNAESALREVLQNDASHKQDMRARTLELGQEMFFARKTMEEILKEAAEARHHGDGDETPDPPFDLHPASQRWQDDEHETELKVLEELKPASESSDDDTSDRDDTGSANDERKSGKANG